MRDARPLFAARLRRAAIAIGAATAGLLLATTMTTAATASTDVTVSPRDNCGGFNGHVVWSATSIELYGEVWENGCPDATSVWLSWDAPGYENIDVQTAAASQTEGVNFQRATSAAPQDIKVAVCSTSGGWHCGTPVDGSSPPSPTTTSSTTSTPSTPPTVTATTTAPVAPTVTVTTPAPVVTVPVTVPVPRPVARPRALRVKLAISWTWDRTTTRVGSVTIGRVPVSTGLRLRCQGPSCPLRVPAVANGRSGVRRMLHDLAGRVFRAGDRLLLALHAPGWRSERAEIQIRAGRVPTVRLLAA